MSQIEVKNLALAYDGVAVFKELDFKVEKGEYICIVGENGSGKSTLIKAMLGQVKPLTGEIVFEDKKKAIGYLPQQTEVQRDFPASVFEVVLSGFLSKSKAPFFGATQKSEAKGIMKSFGLSEISGKCYRELSGGQQQRVLLARAFCATGDIIILDEPVTGLDNKAVAEMYSAIADINKKGVTVIMVTHDVEAAVLNADKILHLSHEINFFGTVSEYKASDIAHNLLKGGAF
jgi:zinc transport system ATP-binding protein